MGWGRSCLAAGRPHRDCGLGPLELFFQAFDVGFGDDVGRVAAWAALVGVGEMAVPNPPLDGARTDPEAFGYLSHRVVLHGLITFFGAIGTPQE